MKKKAIFPGSFDPITIGHNEIIEKSLKIFDEIIIAVGMNPEKKYMFSLIQRMEFISKTFHEKKSISVKSYKGLTIEFCKKNKIANSIDFAESEFRLLIISFNL